jgi:hypothetical protein
MCPIGPPSYHSKYIYHNFKLQPHRCRINCTCVSTKCTEHWLWKDATPPPNISTPWDYPCIDYQLYYFGAYQGPVSGQTKKHRFAQNYPIIVNWVKDLNGTTIFCDDWNSEGVKDVFDKVKAVFAGSTVATTKTLYFFIPDLFIILDRAQVWSKWKRECAGTSILPRKIKDVDGKAYVALLKYVKEKITSAIRCKSAFTLGGNALVNVNSLDELRLVTPLQLVMPNKIGHTFGKVIDNIIR